MQLPDTVAAAEGFSATDDDYEMLLQREYLRYGRNSERFTSICYPAWRAAYVPTPRERASIVLHRGALLASCTRCGEPLGYRVVRSFVGEAILCCQCLRGMGCCYLGSTLHYAVVAAIMMYVPEYFQVVRMARVSKLWLSCVNWDDSRESDMMAAKRYWISREIYWKFEERRNDPLVVAFQEKFDLGRLLRDWMDCAPRNVHEWLRLAKNFARSKYYVRQLNLYEPASKSDKEIFSFPRDDAVALEVRENDGDAEPYMTISFRGSVISGQVFVQGPPNADPKELQCTIQTYIKSQSSNSGKGAPITLTIDLITGALFVKKKKKRRTIPSCTIL